MEPPTVVVLGHSFVRRLRTHVFAEQRKAPRSADPASNFGIDKSSVSVFLHGVGGLTLPNAYLELPVVAELGPDVVIFQIGENDLDRRGVSPSDLDKKIILLARIVLRETPAKLVVVSQLLSRPSPRNSAYTSQLHQVNSCLKLLLKDISAPIFYLPHFGLWRQHDSLYARDGVHLNSEGNRKLARSLRGATLKSLQKLQ